MYLIFTVAYKVQKEMGSQLQLCLIFSGLISNKDTFENLIKVMNHFCRKIYTYIVLHNFSKFRLAGQPSMQCRLKILIC